MGADFPLGLLQMACKVTLEPPKGMKAGLYRTYSTMVNQDFLEKVEPYEKWRPLTYAVCFLHSVVQERRAFGPIGFSMPYEFNSSDLDASLLYMEKHMTQCAIVNRRYEWDAMQLMTCAIQYGGKITQELDRDLFFTYGYLFIREDIFSGSFQFNQSTNTPCARIVTWLPRSTSVPNPCKKSLLAEPRSWPKNRTLWLTSGV